MTVRVTLTLDFEDGARLSELRTALSNRVDIFGRIRQADLTIFDAIAGAWAGTSGMSVERIAPPVPQGIGAVIEDTNGNRWVRATGETRGTAWLGSDGLWSYDSDISDVLAAGGRVVSDGVILESV